jgi:hypothetical protein
MSLANYLQQLTIIWLLTAGPLSESEPCPGAVPNPAPGLLYPAPRRKGWLETGGGGGQHHITT